MTTLFSWFAGTPEAYGKLLKLELSGNGVLALPFEACVLVHYGGQENRKKLSAFALKASTVCWICRLTC
ncbi:hypothetical protein ACFLYL_03925 [Chloroflexota bacterium]